MNTIPMAAIRAYDRLVLSFYSEAEEFEECDRHFDGGEWSGPAWADVYDAARTRFAKLVCEKFWIDYPVDLEIAAEEKYHREIDYHREALGGVPTIYK